MAEQGIGEAEVAFRVLEVDRVDLVGHGGGTHFAGLQRLLEVTQRDVTPDVARQVDQDDVGAAYHVAIFGNAVMRLDLRGVGVVIEPQAFHETLRETAPVEFRIGDGMRVVVAHGAIDLARHFQRDELLALTLQARHYIGQFLAQRAG